MSTPKPPTSVARHSMKARRAVALAMTLLAVTVTFAAAPSAVYAQTTTSPGASTSDASQTPEQVGLANQPGTTTGASTGATGGGTATQSTPTAGSGTVVAVGALALLAMGIGAFVAARQKRLHDLDIS